MRKLPDKKIESKTLISEEETKQFGRELALSLKVSTIVALHGDLGAGKTTLAKGIISQIGAIDERNVQSPTFTYLSLYETEPPIYHFDLYRLKTAEEFIHLGFLDFFGNQGICLIEWAERITPLLPAETIHIKLSQIEEGRRKVDVYKI